MAGIVYTKLIDALKGIGVDVSQQQGSNVKKLAPKNKSTATKPGLLASLLNIFWLNCGTCCAETIPTDKIAITRINVLFIL